MARHLLSRVESFSPPNQPARTFLRPKAARYSNGRNWNAHYYGAEAVGTWCLVTVGEGIDLVAAALDPDVIVFPARDAIDVRPASGERTALNTKLTAAGFTSRADANDTVREILGKLAAEQSAALDLTVDEQRVRAIAVRKGWET